MELTIVTWNIGGGKPIKDTENFSFRDEDYLDENVEYFANELKKLSPDIISLQETHIRPGKSVAKEIADLLGGYEVSEIGLSESHIDKSYLLGNSILTKVKWSKEDFHYLPYPTFPLARRDGGITVKHEKVCQVLKFPFGSVANVHLQPLAFLGTKYESPNGLIYAKKVEEVLEKSLEKPIVLCGDFNYTKAEELYPSLIQKLSLSSVLPNEPTRPDGKITDYIFVSSEFSLVDSGIIKTSADHYLCWVKLLVKAPGGF